MVSALITLWNTQKRGSFCCEWWKASSVVVSPHTSLSKTTFFSITFAKLQSCPETFITWKSSSILAQYSIFWAPLLGIPCRGARKHLHFICLLGASLKPTQKSKPRVCCSNASNYWKKKMECNTFLKALIFLDFSFLSLCPYGGGPVHTVFDLFYPCCQCLTNYTEY